MNTQSGQTFILFTNEELVLLNESVSIALGNFRSKLSKTHFDEFAIAKYESILKKLEIIQHAQILSERENVTLILTPEEQEIIQHLVSEAVQYSVLLVGVSDLAQAKLVNKRLHNKLHYLLPNIGDACRHSAHIPEALGQGGNQ